ncbi:secretin receptor-like isoform X2 [Mercenaria mercenaria]|uniref:secretin receptor-like isoform X2 n=1 Tax=Mercenaria mercenaria TaxID=6596 RepID=UPI00234F10DD|nr:secretin receptor-like isoform X2 [Mercenaria mercenaria]
MSDDIADFINPNHPERQCSIKLLLFVNWILMKSYLKSTAIVSLVDQEKIILDKSIECMTQIYQEASNSTNNGCPRVWDGVMCWPPTDNGTVMSIPCPNYVNGFKPSEMATRTCDSTGEWWINPVLNGTWTNLTLCSDRDSNFHYDVPKIIAAHMDRIRLMYNIGYGISLVSLLLAVIVMIYFKRLHCPRNTIHINLFVSFIFRAIISFVKENALKQGVGLSFDVEVAKNGNIQFLEDSSHWQCKIFFSFFNYILGANYMWIFTEGIYLHMLITVAMFSEKSGIKRLLLFGWGAPIVFVIPWVIIRATLEDVLCWNTHPTPGYFWMIRGPIVGAMVINFFIFLNIIRVLFTKLNAFKTPDVKRKLAKSTLVLIPLFGVHYIVFIGLPDKVDETTELVKLYYEMFFNSFQGFLVSLLFCFLNGEVQTEIKKKWRRYVLKRGGSGFRRAGRETLTSYISRTRGSVASASAYALEKDIPNGKSRYKVDKNTQNGNSSTDNSEHIDRNGLISCNTSDHEAHSMIELTPPSGQHYRNEDVPLILNNNENIKNDETSVKD